MNELLKLVNGSNATVCENDEKEASELRAYCNFDVLRRKINSQCPDSDKKRKVTLGFMQYLVKHFPLDKILENFDEFIRTQSTDNNDTQPNEGDYWRETYLYYLIINAEKVYEWQMNLIIGDAVLPKPDDFSRRSGKDVAPTANTIYKAKFNDDIKLTYHDFINDEAVPSKFDKKVFAELAFATQRAPIVEKAKQAVSDYIYKQFVLSVKKLIETTSWVVNKTFGIGGQTINISLENKRKMVKSVPDNIHKLYLACLKAEAAEKAGQCDWHDHFSKIALIGEQAKPLPRFHLFHKRDENTQLCYDKIDQMVKAVRSKAC